MLYKRAMLLSALLPLCASCGGGSGDSAAAPPPVAIVTPTPAPSPTSSPAPTPAPPPSAPAQAPAASVANLVQLASIPSNFDTAAEKIPASLPPSMAPDVVGAFRMTCKPSHNSYDDPIVFANQPGAAHLHTFFGNTKADAYSTYASLRTTGESTCHSKLNRSAYWIPALMNGSGKVVMPDFLTVYYKRFPANSAYCQNVKCVPIPRGLRMVFGRKMDASNAGAAYFNCQGTGATPGVYPTFAEAAKNCPSGAQIGAVTAAQACWNGSQLDSPDHRSHMADEYRDSATNTLRCPATHPYMIPHFILSAWYTTDNTLDRSGSNDPAVQTWHFSSDRMPGMAKMPSGSTFHADWFGAWDDDTLMAWQNNCIDGFLSCSTGNLGNGTALKWLAGFNLKADQRLVDPPVRVTAALLCTGKRKLKSEEREMINALRKRLEAVRGPRTMMAASAPKLPGTMKSGRAKA